MTGRRMKLGREYQFDGKDRLGLEIKLVGKWKANREIIRAREGKASRKSKAARLIICIAIIGFIMTFLPSPQVVQAAAATLSAPSSVKVGPVSYDGVNISWSGVKGATGYSVYRAESKTGTYALIKTTSSKSYEDFGLTTGKNYYYKVRAYKKASNKKVFGVYSAVKSAKPVPLAPATVNATSLSYNSVTVGWEPVKGASGYQVYVATTEAGTFSLIKTTKEISYRNEGLTTGSTYYYKVRAYTKVNGKKIYGEYTAVVNATPILAEMSTVTATATDYGRIDLSWQAVEGVEGYEIERALTADQQYTLLSSGTATEYSDAALMLETSYDYRVRAFLTVGDSKIYSDYSTVVSGMIHTVKVAAVSLNKTEDILILGNVEKLEASITPANATNTSLAWSSSDPSVATVDGEGNITSLKAGTAVITVATVDGGFTSFCTVTVNNAAIKGIDVSKWQKTIDWAAVKGDGIEFAMIRATYGSSSVDPMFETNYQGAKANGIAVGIYHYSYATTVEAATTEVKFLISKLAGKQMEYPVCVDVEDSSQSKLDKKTLTDIIIVYLSELQNAGYYPMIYSNRNWFNGKFDDTRLAVFDHWLAQWGTTITYGGPVSMWQYSATGSVKGIAGKVDLDLSFVDYATRIKQLGLNGF